MSKMRRKVAAVTLASDGGAIRAINGDGAVDCIDQAVFPISADLNSTDHPFAGTAFFPSNLNMVMRCEFKGTRSGHPSGRGSST